MTALAWQEFALCRGTDIDQWYPGRGVPVPDEARALCDACPAWKACRDWAIYHERFGFWAGTSERQRRVMRRRSGIRLIEIDPDELAIRRAPTDDELEAIEAEDLTA